jgi:hypothetical protein
MYIKKVVINGLILLYLLFVTMKSAALYLTSIKSYIKNTICSDFVVGINITTRIKKREINRNKKKNRRKKQSRMIDNQKIKLYC